jgi:adenylylsulfate kinase-like enzyme
MPGKDDKFGSVIWVTGLSGAGKTTLCSSLYQSLKPRLPTLVLLDGDVVRQAFGNDLTHQEEDRVRQVRRLQGMSNVLARQGLTVIVAVLYNSPDLLRWNRETIPNYFEVYLKASLVTVRERDNKGLYEGARAGRIDHVVGLDIPWHEPKDPDLVIDVDAGHEPGAVLRTLTAALTAADLIPEP